MERFAAIAREITALTGTRCALGPQRRVTGGSINECYCWPGDAGAMFVKVAALEARAMFAAEAAGLAELERSHAVRVPRVLASGHTQHAAFLALEWIEAGVAGPDCEARLGTELAALHGVTAPRFGWVRDNTIGRTPPANAPRPRSSSWPPRTGLRTCSRLPVSGCSSQCTCCSPATARPRRCCTETCGAATGSRARAVSRCCSTRR